MYDIVYIGGGLNYAGATVAAKNGKKVGLIESDLNQLGGICLHKGCIPCSGFDLIEGKGKRIVPHQVEVNGEIIEGEHIVIGTGSSAFVPKEIERNAQDIIINDDALELQKLPKRGRHISFEDKNSIYKEMLLVATGRVPNVDVVDCDEVEVKRGITTDAFFETTLAKHYAIGDCNGKLQLAHAARAEVLNVTECILGKNSRTLNLEHVVKFIYTLLMSYACVGKIASGLEKEGVQYRQSLVTLNQFKYSAYNHALDGLMVSYVDKSSFILGAEIVAPNAEELIASVVILLAGEMDVAVAKRIIMGHPTFSEALERVFYKL